MIELKNEQLTIRVAEKGAELQSVKDRKGREYMWQAGPEWPRHSPILFPLVCSVNNNTYRVDGKEYHLPRQTSPSPIDWRTTGSMSSGMWRTPTLKRFTSR